MTILSDDRSIELLALRVIDRSLPKSEWTHEGHFAAALWLLRVRKDLTAPDKIRRLITEYNLASNTLNTDQAGYHHTITLASIRASSDHLAKYSSDAPLHFVLKDLMASKLGHRDWVLSYWGRHTLFSVKARRFWVEPDIAPLPF